MPPNSLDIPTTPNYLCLLTRKHYLTEPALEYALRRIGIVPDAKAWRHFLNKMLLFIGTALLLAGIIFFFAFNWADMSRFEKFGLLQVGILGTAVFASLRGLEHLSGQAALLAAAVLVGALLAVYGQIYQTGADPFTLFLVWAILIIPWVLMGAFAPLWFLLLVLLNLSLILYWEQVIDSRQYGGETALFLLLFLLNSVAMIVWEYTYRQGVTWLKGYWLGVVIFCAALTFIMIPTLEAILEFRHFRQNSLLPIAALLYIGFTAFFLWYYNRQRPDLLLLAVCLLGVIITLTTFVVKLLPINALTLLVIALAIIGQAYLATKWLLHIAKEV
jgi:uncharacterized membrane protein